MEKIWTNAVKAASAYVGLLVGLFGGWTPGSRVLVVLMVMDYVLGCVCALVGRSGKTESGHFLTQVAFMGILKKAVEILVVLLAALLDNVLAGSVAGGALFRSAAEFFYIATESLSIVENAGLIGVPVPKGLRHALEALREKSDESKGQDPQEREEEHEDE